MRSKIEYLLKCLQMALLYLSYFLFSLINKQPTKTHWVIGVDEIAKNIFYIGRLLKQSTSISFRKNKFYDLKYNYSINVKNIYINHMLRIFYGPILLGFLANKSTHFLYIWSTGFLFDRDFEFKFLKSKNKKIVCLFVGNDIRSLKLMTDYANQHNIDTFANYHENAESIIYDNKKQKLASSADKYADLIFNAPVDQISYLESQQFAWPYIYNKNDFSKNNSKFENIKKIKITHAPSDPIAKGTPLVKAAIKKLQIEGYEFEYVEIQNMSNKVVLEHLKTTHIVLNQFYSFMPGLCGIEAMANYCAVLMSADYGIEKTLPQDSKDAWLITKYWQVYDNLKHLLDNPEKIKFYADNGYEFAYKHYTYEAAKDSLYKTLKKNGVID